MVFIVQCIVCYGVYSAVYSVECVMAGLVECAVRQPLDGWAQHLMPGGRVRPTLG